MRDGHGLDLALLILRVAAGGFLLPLALGKLFGWFNGPGLAGFAGELRGFGLPAAAPLPLLRALLQVVAGTAVMLGWQARIAYELLRFQNRRLVRLARRRQARGTYGRRNIGWSSMVKNFGTAELTLTKAHRRGLALWLRAELRGLLDLLPHRAAQESASPARAPGEAPAR